MEQPQKTYFSRSQDVCPVCDVAFNREDLLTGGGRLNAASLTAELHRLYVPSEKFGAVFPLIYSMQTCPSCLVSMLPSDFSRIKKRTAQQLRSSVEQNRRKNDSTLLLGSLPDMRKKRELRSGIVSYIAAILCYEIMPKEFCPVFRQGMCSLRCAWLLAHLHNDEPHENFAYAARIMYRKAAFFYTQALELSDAGSQPLINSLIGGYGPDVDHNFGVDGVIYLAAFLQLHYNAAGLPETRKKSLETAKFHLSLLVGSGKASQRKTSEIIDNARSLYREITAELHKLQ